MASFLDNVMYWLADEKSIDKNILFNEKKTNEENGSILNIDNKYNEHIREKNSLEMDLEEVSSLAFNTVKDIGSYIFNVGKSYTIQAVNAAKQIKNTIGVENMLGEFSKEQVNLMTSQRERKKILDSTVPPWEGCLEEDFIKSQILDLSKDRQIFLTNPIEWTKFNFNFENSFSVALVMLNEDPQLKALRFELVPKLISEETFWHNYFYRVSLIKQATKLNPILSSKGYKFTFPEEKYTDQTVSCCEERLGILTFNEPDYKVQQMLSSPTEIENQTKNKDKSIPDWERELQAELDEYVIIDNFDDDFKLDEEIMKRIQSDD